MHTSSSPLKQTKKANCTYEVPQTAINSDILDKYTTAATIFLYYFLNKYVAPGLLLLHELIWNICWSELVSYSFIQWEIRINRFKKNKQHTTYTQIKINNITFSLSLVLNSNHHATFTMNQLSVEEMLWDGEEYCDTAICTDTF